MVLVLQRKLEIEQTPPAVFAIKTPRYVCYSVSPDYFIFVTIKWVSLSTFPWTQSNLNLKIKKRLNFNDVLWQVVFEIFHIWSKYARLERIPPPFSNLKQLQRIDPSFVTITKLSSNEIRETFYKVLKQMCKLFEINVQQDF